MDETPIPEPAFAAVARRLGLTLLNANKKLPSYVLRPSTAMPPSNAEESNIDNLHTLFRRMGRYYGQLLVSPSEPFNDDEKDELDFRVIYQQHMQHDNVTLYFSGYTEPIVMPDKINVDDDESPLSVGGTLFLMGKASKKINARKHGNNTATIDLLG